MYPSKRKTPDTSAMVYGKLPPQALDLETAVLGALMLELSSLEIVLPILKSTDFYTEANSKIYNSILQLFTNGSRIDFMTVCEQLMKNGELEQVGGSYYVTGLTRDVVSSAHIEEHARIVKQKSMMRGIIQVCGKTLQDAFDNTCDVFELNTKLQLDLTEIEEGIKTQSVSPIGKVAVDTLNEMMIRSENPNELIGLRTGFTKLDEITLGLSAPDLIILAGGTGEGKSTFALQMAKQITDSDEPVAFFSLEMKNKQLMWKIFSADLQVDVKTIRRAHLQQNQWDTLNSKVTAYQNKKLYMYDQGGLSIFELRSICRSLKAKYGIKAVFIDYLQLLTVEGSTKNFGIREQEVNYISKQLKEMAMELDLPVIALSQLNRIEKGSKRMYRLNDLRESGAIEQDADGVLFVWRPTYHDLQKYKLNGHDETFFEEDDVVIQMAKWRLGDTGYIRMKFIGKESRFDDRNISESTYRPTTPEESQIIHSQPAPTQTDLFDDDDPF